MMFKTKVFIAKSMAKKFYGDAMKSMKELSGKSITKAKGLKTKTLSKASSFKAKKAQYYKDVDMYKGSILKQFAADARQEGRDLRKVAKRIKPLQTAFKYPITTGFVAGGSLNLAFRDKKNNNKKG
jgi:hypothetical protein